MRPVDIRRSSVPVAPPDVEPPPPPPPGGWGKTFIIGLTDRKGLGGNGSGGTVQVKNGVGVLQDVDLVATGRIRGAVYDPDWRQMEPTPGNYVWPAQATTFFNNATTRGFDVRLRLQVGKESPGWVFDLVTPGGLQGLWEPQNIGGVNPFDIPWVWDDLYLDAADAFFQWVSDNHGSHARLADIALTQPSTYYEEMFQWQMPDNGDPASGRTSNRVKYVDTKFVNAGRAYTKQKQLDSYLRTVATASTLFPGKSKNIIYNAFNAANQDYTLHKPNGLANEQYQVMEAARLTNQIHHMNHSGRIWTSGDYLNLYQKMDETDQPMSIQTLATGNSWWTANPTVTYYDVCRWLVDNYRVVGLELAGTSALYTSPEYSTTTAQPADSGSRKKLTLTQMDDLNARMEANAAHLLAA